MTVQELSTIIRQKVKATILVLNNKGYTIEVEIHDGPYNDIQNWDYAGLVKVFNGGSNQGLGLTVDTPAGLVEALRAADANLGLTLIECVLSRDDCTSELLLWGSNVATANMRA